MLSLFGWIGNIAFILGALFLAKKMISGWYMQILGNACYVVFALLMGKDGISLFILSLVLIGINIYGLYQWRNKNARQI